MDKIIEEAIKAYRISDEDKASLLGIRAKIRDIGGYQPNLSAIGKEYYEEYLEEFDPSHVIRDDFGYENLAKGVMKVEEWVQLPSGNYILNMCIRSCIRCPYGHKSRIDCPEYWINPNLDDDLIDWPDEDE